MKILKKATGALVASVGENSPADKAGLKDGDIILEFDGKKINTMRKLPKVVANTEVGKKVELKLWRNKKMISKRLTLGRLESSAEFKDKKPKIKKVEEFQIDTLKITVRDINPSDVKQRSLEKNLKGSVILDISSRSPLSGKLNVNDIIIEVQKKGLKTSANLNEIVNKIIKQNQPLYLTIINNNNQKRYVAFKLK